MGTDGKRRPPRPRIEMLTEPGSDEEATAIVAALERFLTETAPSATSDGPFGSAWQRAALREAVTARDIAGRRWGAG